MGTFDKCPKSNLNFDNPRWAGFPQNSNSKFGRGSAQILNLNFAAPAGPARTTFPRPGRKIFAARGGENFVAGVRKSCGPGYLIAKGCAFSELCIILYIFLFFNKKTRLFGPDRLFHELWPPEGD